MMSRLDGPRLCCIVTYDLEEDALALPEGCIGIDPELPRRSLAE